MEMKEFSLRRSYRQEKERNGSRNNFTNVDIITVVFLRQRA